jgi:hypothetical protein
VDEELERFKTEISLVELAGTYGYRLPRGQQLWLASSLVMKNEESDDKIVIRRDSDRHWTYFSVRDPSDNGTVVDFIQHRRRVGLGAVRQELRGWVSPGLGGLRPALGLPAARRRDFGAVDREYREAALLARSPYLRSRGIRDATLASERFRGTVRVDRRGNVLFGHLHPEDPERICGFERKNRGFTSFSTGGMRTVWASRALAGDDRFVFVEGAIDALSYQQLHPSIRARYFSTAGSVGTFQLQYITKLVGDLPPSSTIVLATDRDEAGERLAKQIAEVAGKVPLLRHPSPIGKDWNDYLQARERDRIRSLCRERGPSRGR